MTSAGASAIVSHVFEPTEAQRKQTTQRTERQPDSKRMKSMHLQKKVHKKSMVFATGLETLIQRSFSIEIYKKTMENKAPAVKS